MKVLFDYSLLPASAVPNVRASARPHRPAQSQGDAFLEEFLKSQNEALPRQDPEPEHVLQSNQAQSKAQQTIPPKIFDTPPPQVLTKDSWRTILHQQDIEQDDTDDDDTDTAIPIVKPSSYKPGGTSSFTTFPRTPMPIAKETPIDQSDASGEQANMSKVHQNWQINVRPQAQKQADISPMPKTELPVQQSTDATIRQSKPTFEADYIPVTSLPIDLNPASLVETPATTIDEPEENTVSAQPMLNTQQSEAIIDANDIETPEDIQDSTPSAAVSTSPATTQFTQETEHADDADVLLSANDAQSSPDTFSDSGNSQPITPTIEQAQAEESTQEERVLSSMNQIEHEDLLDFLRYIQPSEPIYQPTQTLPIEVEQITFPPSTDHSALKLSAQTGENSSPFSETINMHALSEEQLPTQNILDNLFDADTSSMPAFLEQLSNFGAHIVPTKSAEDANATTQPDLTSSNMPTLLNTPAISLPDVPTEPNLSSSDMPTLLDTSAISLPDMPDQSNLASSDMSTLLDSSVISLPDAPDASTLLDTSATPLPETPNLIDGSTVTSPTDSSRQFDITLASSTRKTKKRLKALKAAQASKEANMKTQQDKKRIEEITTSATQEPAVSDIHTIGSNNQNDNAE